MFPGEEPAWLWKEIELILRETAQDFPGYHLTYFYLCPRCIIELCGCRQLESLPEEVLSDRISVHDLEDKEKDKKDYICNRSHITAAPLVKGYSNSALHSWTHYKTFAELPTDQILQLSLLLGGSWIALLTYFDKELQSIKADIETRETSDSQKVLLILNGLKNSTEVVLVARLKEFIDNWL